MLSKWPSVSKNNYSGNDGMHGKWSNASKMKKNVFKIIKWFENDGMLWK